MVTNPTDRAITCPANLILATESRAEVDGEFATLAAHYGVSTTAVSKT